MKQNSVIRRYQQRCFRDYAQSIGLPANYTYPTGNPIRPLPPVQTTCGGLMIVGAYPSARFESRKSSKTGRRRLIPIADNLQPFGTEVYFDGTQVRRLESGAGIKEYLLDPLGLGLEDCWVTDLVKVFLYKRAHQDSCRDAVPGFEAPVLRGKFMELARKSLPWFAEECELCQPKVVVTLGEEVARAVTGSKEEADQLLSVEARYPKVLNGVMTLCCPHPDGCRRSEKWRGRMREILTELSQGLLSNVPQVTGSES